MVNSLDKTIDNFLNDITTALPYSDYIRSNIGNYVIIDDKPYIIQGMKFHHTQDKITMRDGYVIYCYVILENTANNAYLSLNFEREQILQAMDNPMLIIDVVNKFIRQKLKFINKNKTTDLLFKNEG